MNKLDKILRKFDMQFHLSKYDRYLGRAIKSFIRAHWPEDLSFPTMTKEIIHKAGCFMFIQLKKIRGKKIKDTIIAYDEDDLMINVDIDRKGKACGIEIVYYGKES